MKTAHQVLGLVLLGSCLTGAPTVAAQAAPVAPAAAERSAVQQVRDDAAGPARITAERATGRIGFARADDLLPEVGAGSARGAANKASAYLDRHAAAFGARPGELARTGVRRTDAGWTVEFDQSYRGVPVFGGRLLAHVDPQGDLTSVTGFAAPDLDLAVTPRLGEREAADRAVALVDGTDLVAVRSELTVYRMGSPRGVEGEPVLAWVVEVTNRRDVRETVVLDATSGKSVNRWSMIAQALERELYDESATPDDLIWEEGDLYPGLLDADERRAVLGTGETYWMFRNTFGRDSYDDEGSPMRTVVDADDLECPNARWNGVTTSFCAGVTSDDIVAHEWAHAYTEHTSGLVYQWQPGAINEAYSDIWGETVDLLNDRLNSDHEQVRRRNGRCSARTPQRLVLEITAPASVAGPCRAVAAADGPLLTDEVLTPRVVVGVDGIGKSNDGCSRLVNEDEVRGNWLYVDENFGREGCSYTRQGRWAEAAGARGIIVGATPPYQPFDMANDAFTIPALQVDSDSGSRFKAAGVATIRLTATTSPDDPSERWLVSEEDAGFGGAIRDMWNPTCYGDPGKVSDQEYHCGTGDDGGVHVNSGVVNHTYALLVDGGTYNDVVVPGIGLDGAAHVFWRTQTDYLTPTSDFADLADGLVAACTDLVGVEINRVTLGEGPTGGGPADVQRADDLSTYDCAAVDAATRATELRAAPVQCTFGPLLAPGRPAACGPGLVTTTVLAEDFEDGLAGWTPDEELGEDATGGIAWAPATAPGGRPGLVAYAADPDRGACVGGGADLSSRNGLVSPTVTYPAGAAARLSFDHYVATEAGVDGGNVKVSVAGGEFTEIPYTAYVFNAPGLVLNLPEQDNTNPMAGEVAFSGTDGGVPAGSWGTSVVDLARIPGARAGDELRFRFDFGRDACDGVDGWYIDDVTVTVCREKTVPTVTASRSPEPTRYGVASTLVVNVTGDGPTGTVTVSAGGQPLGSGHLAAGRIVLPLPASYPTGTHALSVVYSGDDRNRAASTGLFVTVGKAASRTKASAPKSVLVGRPVKVPARVTAGSLRPTGKVVVRLQGRKVASGRLDGRGRLTLKVARLKPGKRVLTVSYRGSGTIGSSSARVVVRVRPAR